MSVDDFCRCTPPEFYAVWHAYSEQEQRRERGEWERMRMECLCSLQPHSRKKLSARDLMTFPWEKETERKEEETITADELRKRCERAKAQWGLK